MKTPQQILDEQEPSLHLMEMARDRFACGSWPESYDHYLPSTPEDYLAWIEDEINIQTHQISLGHEYSERSKYVSAMAKVALALRFCGVMPANDRLPWNIRGES